MVSSSDRLNVADRDLANAVILLRVERHLLTSDWADQARAFKHRRVGENVLAAARVHRLSLRLHLTQFGGKRVRLTTPHPLLDFW